MVVVKAEGLKKSYPQGGGVLTVLDGIDLEVSDGQLIAVLGPSGSGKTTLLNLLGLLDRPTGGRLELFGQQTSSLSEDGRAALRNRRVGFVFQFDSLLVEFTVLENVALPFLIREGASVAARREAFERARALLARLGLEAAASRSPRGLSGGEKQRAAIARALINSPELILADEPTGNLDSLNAERVFEDLARIAREMGVAVVLVTHNERACAFATRVFHLSNGRLASAVATGP